jgi:hypothetical protein
LREATQNHSSRDACVNGRGFQKGYAVIEVGDAGIRMRHFVAKAAETATTVCLGLTTPAPKGNTSTRLGLICQPEAGQRHAREAEAEFLHRRAARDRPSDTFYEFIELVVHSSSFY